MRWTVLLATLALWLGSLLAVYLHCRPVQFDDLDSNSRAALDRMFAENAAELHGWKIYVDRAEVETARKMFASNEKALTAPHRTSRREWNGFDESALVLAGRAETRIKNKRQSSSTLDEETTLKLELPGTGFQANYKGVSHLTFERGLESCSMALKLKSDGFDLDAISSANRERDELNITNSVVSGGKTVYTGSRRQSVLGSAALTSDFAPFQYNANAKPYQEWTIVTFDLDMAMSGENEGIKALKVHCTPRTSVMMHGERVEAFEVRSDDGSARAWYSPDGVVLKQVFKLAGLLEVMLVRDDPAK